MSEKNETDHTNVQESPKDRVGDIIRKERITRRITVETIAKDLKLNVKYIKSLEASEYEALPADPYIRVYFRSLAKYLSLDSEEILKRFYEERGLSPEHLNKDNDSKITISVKEKEPKRNPTLLITIVLIVLLASFSFLANKKGWISAPAQVNSSDSLSTKPLKTEAASDSVPDDSLIIGASGHDTTTASVKDTVSKKAEPKAAVAKNLKLRIATTTDSVWAQVFSDGQSWKSIIRKDQPKEFFASDSFNVHCGNNPSVIYSLNGKNVKVKGNGVVFFKIDSTGVPIPWGNTRWTTVFKDRL